MKRLLRLLVSLCIIGGLSTVSTEAVDKTVAFTFDDGPSGRFTQQLLEGLEEREAKATFFLCGYRMELYPDLPAQILEAGHEVGLHGYSHDSMCQMSREQLEAELDKTQDFLYELTGKRVKTLRPPGGENSGLLRQVAQEKGLSLIHWSVDPRDWATQDCQQVINNLLKEIEDGDIILMHDMSQSSVDAALEVMDQLAKEGYRFVTVSELLTRNGEEMKPGCWYHKRSPSE